MADTEQLGCDLVPTQDHPPIVLSDDGVWRQLADGEIVNAGGTSYSFWTVGGKGLLFDDGSSTSPCGAPTGGLAASITLQAAYNNSPSVAGSASIKLSTGKDLTISDDTDDGLFFRIDSETGKVTITGDLEVLGQSSIIDTVVTDADHWLISPKSGTTIALKIEPDLGVTPVVDLVSVRRVFGEDPSFRIDADGNVFTKLINGIDLVKHIDGTAHHHMAEAIDITPIVQLPGAENVQQALEALSSNSGLNGMAIPLAAVGGFPSDGSFTPGAVPLTDRVLVTDAIDSLNEILARLIPTSPPDLSTFSLSVPSVGNQPLKALGDAQNNTGGAVPIQPDTAGNSVVISNVSGRITSANPSSVLITGAGDGNAGFLATVVNDIASGNELAEFTNDPSPVASTVGATVMTGRGDFPIDKPGFWRSFNVQAVMSSLDFGWNKVKITHNLSGQTNEFYMLRDNLSSNPTISATAVAQVGSPTFAYSSGVPHYGDITASIVVSGLSMSNIAGETYFGGNPVSFTATNSVINAQSKSYTDVGIATPIPRQTLNAVSLNDQTLLVDAANTHNAGNIQGAATNVNGSSTPTNMASMVILVKRGSAGSRVDELNIPVSGLGSAPNSNNAVRRGGFSNLDQPPVSGDAAWVQTDLLATHEAAVVGGLLSHNVQNYTTGFLPVGPDLSAGRSGSQYFTCSFQRGSRSNFKIVVAGTYTRCWVALPAVSTVSSSTGWWDMGVAFSGSGFPGDTGGNGSNGCAEGAIMAGSGGTFTCTFGTQSSTNSTGNNIIVRFKLAPGQSITSLRFSN